MSSRGLFQDSWIKSQSATFLCRLDSRTASIRDFFVCLVPGDGVEYKLSGLLEKFQNIVDGAHSQDGIPFISFLHFEAPIDSTPSIHDIFQRVSGWIASILATFDFHCDYCANSVSVSYTLTEEQLNICLNDLTHNLSRIILQSIPKVSILTDLTKLPSSHRITLTPPDVQLGPSIFNMQEFCSPESPTSSNSWSIRLYSRDPVLRLDDPEVYEMCTSVESDSFGISSDPPQQCICDESPGLHGAPSIVKDSIQPLQSNCSQTLSTQNRIRSLGYRTGDFVALLSSCCLPARQGCPVGVNLITGSKGIFDLSKGRRVPVYRSWLLHGTIPINKTKSSSTRQSLSNNPDVHLSDQSADCLQNVNISPLGHGPSTSGSSGCSTYNAGFSQNISQNCGHVTSELNCHASENYFLPSTILNSSHLRSPSSVFTQPGSADSFVTSRIANLPAAGSLIQQTRPGGFFRPNTFKSRRLFVMRHAERVDVCFGRSWITRCFDKKGVYRRHNLNLPPWLPPRLDYMDYALDSPITQIGLFVSAETGRSLAEAGVRFTACYSSPALRCVQTACEFIRATGRNDLSVRIEPDLFEWLGWYTNYIPRMMNMEQLRDAGYQVDLNYRPISSVGHFDVRESIADYYARSGQLIKHILAMHKEKNACILIVAHACSIAACTHQLVHRSLCSCVSSEEFHHRTSTVPYCGLVLAEENRSWNLVNPPVPNVCSYGHNPDFDWRQLLGTTLCGFPMRWLGTTANDTIPI